MRLDVSQMKCIIEQLTEYYIMQIIYHINFFSDFSSYSRHFVRFGVVKKDYRKNFPVEPTDIGIHNHIIHPHYDTSIKKVNDVALIHLDEAVPFTGIL